MAMKKKKGRPLTAVERILGIPLSEWTDSELNLAWSSAYMTNDVARMKAIHAEQLRRI